MTSYPDLELYIDGRWKRADGQPVINPADENVLGTVPTATLADLDDALAAAERGFATWRKTSPAKRTQIILKAASLIRQRVDDMATAMTLEQGKPIDQARRRRQGQRLRPRRRNGRPAMLYGRQKRIAQDDLAPDGLADDVPHHSKVSLFVTKITEPLFGDAPKPL
jgi:acyl-CoA reductase-like NAD-dependent aldehyde dehydrogenase